MPSAKEFLLADESAPSARAFLLNDDQPPAAPPADDNELYGFGRALERGGRAFVQQGDVIGLRRPGELERELAQARIDLADFDKEFTGKQAPQRWRADQLGKIAGIEGELARYRKMAPELAESLSSQEKAIRNLPQTEAQAYFQKTDNKLAAFLKDPVEIASGALAESLPMMAGPIIGSALGPIGTAAGAAGSSFAAESSSRVIAGMEKQGVDTTDPKAVLAWFQDRARRDPVTAKADLAALGPAAFDAATGGLAGSILKRSIGKGIARVAAATSGEAGVQMVGGGAGSIVGSKLVGEPIDWGDVLLETVLEIAPIEAVANVRGEIGRNRLRPASKPPVIAPPITQTTEVSSAIPVGEAAPVPVGQAPGSSPTVEQKVRQPTTTTKPPEAAPTVASVPVMITREMEAQLRARGLSDAEISALTPQAANDILAKPVAPKPTEVTVESYDTLAAELRKVWPSLTLQEALTGVLPSDGFPERLQAKIAGATPEQQQAIDQWYQQNEPRILATQTAAKEQTYLTRLRAAPNEAEFAAELAAISARPDAPADLIQQAASIADVNQLDKAKIGAAMEPAFRARYGDSAAEMMGAFVGKKPKAPAPIAPAVDSAELAELEAADEAGMLSAKQKKRLKELRESSKPKEVKSVAGAAAPTVAPANLPVTPVAAPVRYYVGSTGKARGGWLVATVEVDEAGNEKAGKNFQEGIATKKEAREIADAKNEELGDKFRPAAPPTPVAPKPIERTLDSTKGLTLRPAYDNDVGEIPTFNKEARKWWKTVVTEGEGEPQTTGESKKTLVLRDNETGQLHEVLVWNNNGEKIVDPETGKGVAAIDTAKDAAGGLLRKSSPSNPGTPRYTVVAGLRHSEFQPKLTSRPITQPELDLLRAKYEQEVGPVAEGRTVAQGGVGGEGATTEIVDTSNTQKIEPLSELESWLRAKLQDKSTKKLKPITPDMALDLVDELYREEPETAKEVAIDIASPLAKTQQFQDLSRAKQLDTLRKLFASRIYELVARQYEAENQISGQVTERSAGRTPALTEGAIDIEASTAKPAGAATGEAEVLAAEAAALAQTNPTQEQALNFLERADAKLAELQRQIRGGKAFTGITGLEPVVIDGAISVARAALRATNSVVRAVDAAIEWLRTRGATFNENEARVWLTSEINGEARGERFANESGIIDDPDAPAPLPDEQWVPTQTQGTQMFVRARDRLTPESAAVSVRVAQRAFTETGFTPELRTFTDAADRQTKSILFIPKTADADAKGRALALRLEQEIRDQRQQGKGDDYVAMLVNSVRENFDQPDSAFADMASETRNRLFALAQEDASTKGRALRALRNFKMDVIRVGQNVDVMLSRIYYEALGGEQVSSVLRRVTQGVREGLAAPEIQEIARDVPEPQRPAVEAAIGEAVKRPFSSVDDLLMSTRDVLIRGGLTEAQANKIVADIATKLKSRVRSLATKAADKINAGLTDEEAAAVGGKSWKTVADMIASGIFDDAEALKRKAKKFGWRLPTDAEIAEMKRLAGQAESLLALSDKERAAVAGDPVKLQRMLADVEANNRERVFKVQKKLAVMWSEFALPTDFKHYFGAQRENNARFLNELVSANLLFKSSFATKQAIDITTQWFSRLPMRAMAEALDLWRADVRAGRTSNLFKDLDYSMRRAYQDAIIALKPGLVKARAAWAGRVEIRNVDRLLSGMNALDRMYERANELSKQGRNVEAFILRAISTVRFSYRYAGALDFVHGTPAEWHERRFRTVQELRKAGVERAAAEAQADAVMGDIDVEIAEAAATAKALDDARGVTSTRGEQLENAINIVERRQYQRINELGLPMDAIRQKAELYRNTLGWNRPERRGVGGLIGATVTGTGQLLQKVGLPVALGRFGNAIAIGINRNLQRTFLYGLSNIPLPFIKGGTEPSSWFSTRTDIYERRIEAAAWSAIGSVMLGLAWQGVIKVWLFPPRDKEERELWEREGHKPFTVEIPLDDGSVSVWSLNTGPFAMAAPWFVAGGALNELSVKREKQQAKLEADAAKLGLPPGELPPISIAEWFGVAAKAFQGALLGSRTASGLFSSISDFGKWNIKKFAASQFSPLVPGLPAMQEVSRMSGVVIDPDKASIVDFMFPLPTSGARKVNMLGDPVGTENNLQRVVQILTGGSYPVVNLEDAKSLPAYEALFASGYKPPSIDPMRGYAINGQFRPLTSEELAAYTEARGRNFKAALREVGPNADKTTVAAAFRDANEAALTEIGASSPRSTGTRAGQSSQPAGGTAGRVARTTTGSRGGGIGVSYSGGGGYSGSRITGGRRGRSRIRGGRSARSRIRTPRFRKFGGRRQGSRLRRR